MPLLHSCESIFLALQLWTQTPQPSVPHSCSGSSSQNTKSHCFFGLLFHSCLFHLAPPPSVQINIHILSLQVLTALSVLTYNCSALIAASDDTSCFCRHFSILTSCWDFFPNFPLTWCFGDKKCSKNTHLMSLQNDWISAYSSAVYSKKCVPWWVKIHLTHTSTYTSCKVFQKIYPGKARIIIQGNFLPPQQVVAQIAPESCVWLLIRDQLFVLFLFLDNPYTLGPTTWFSSAI